MVKRHLMHCRIKSFTDKLLSQFLAQMPFGITRHEVPIHNLPSSFEEFTIVQISDLHIDQWNRRVVETAIDQVNALKPDLIVFTGDAIAESHHYLMDVTHLLKQLHARHGKLACLGNHDYSDYSGGFGVREALKRAGFDVLVNDSTTLTVGHEQLQFAGADDLILGSQCLNATARRLDDEKPTILLSHNPQNFQAMSVFKPDLILSGHTHGGQLQMPSEWIQKIMGPFIAGFYQQGSSKLYVNRGLGSAVMVEHWGERRISLPTPRFLIQPEISVFSLVKPVFEEKLQRRERELAALAG